ncbi:hypothetical protein CSB69_1430 [Morganella morganii]|nr:hypothetical protein CSB69_1430 [Morganella morganii]EMP50067.1 hypothetical protein C790_02739 [Morganella morganii SC01]
MRPPAPATASRNLPIFVILSFLSVCQQINGCPAGLPVTRRYHQKITIQLADYQ